MLARQAGPGTSKDSLIFQTLPGKAADVSATLLVMRADVPAVTVPVMPPGILPPRTEAHGQAEPEGRVLRPDRV